MKRRWKWALVGTVAVAAATGLWLAYVAQSNYSPRAKLMEALNLAGGARAAVAEYYADNSRFPVNNAEAGLPQSNAYIGKFVSDVSVMANGVIQITLGGTEPDESIAGGTLILQAIVDEGSDGISWSCTAEHLANKYMPHTCR